MSARLDKLSYQQLHLVFKTVIEESELKMSTLDICPFKIPAESTADHQLLSSSDDREKKVNQGGSGECTSGEGRGEGVR